MVDWKGLFGKGKIKLPPWAKVICESPLKIEADPDKFYPVLLFELGFEKTDQYALEVAYQCMKMDLQTAVGRFGFSIKVLNRRNWALKAHPKGKGIALATQGREARAHYIRIRGSIPA